jgi:methyl-accepting chemotaxis protein
VNNKIKEPISNEVVYKITLILVSLVASIFLFKNIAAKNIGAMIVIGVTLAIFAIVQVVVNILKNKTVKYASVSVAMILTIAFISHSSGVSFSDDFTLMLAAIGLGGMYFNTAYPIIQLILSDIVLIVLANLQPEKAGEMGQFRLCMITFNVAAIVMCIMIQRGHAFIEKSNKRAADVEKVIASLAVMNAELNDNFENTEERMAYLQKANIFMEDQTKELKKDSKDITQGVDTTLATCNNAKEKINQSRQNIKFLDEGVKLFEKTLKDNEENMQDMVNNFTLVKDSSQDIARVFEDIQEQTKEIVNVLKQLKNIASSTTMLSINASIEAVRAGESGKGFAVVAGQIKDLAVESNNFSDEVE